MIRVLGIDQSFTSTGWCVTEGDSLIAFGIIKSDKGDNNYLRAKYIAKELASLYLRHACDRVVVEGIPYMAKSNITRDLAGLLYVITYVFSPEKIDDTIFIVPPTKVKKFATGSGKASKEDMFDALPEEAKSKLATTAKSKGRFDITDSYWLSRIGEIL